MIMSNNSRLPMTEKEKQTNPLKGEVAPEDAFVKARNFAVIEKMKLNKPKSHNNNT